MTEKPPFFNDFAQLMSGAVGAAQGLGDEAKALARAQADRFIADMDLVGREEFELLKEELASLRAELGHVREELKVFQGKKGS